MQNFHTWSMIHLLPIKYVVNHLNLRILLAAFFDKPFS
jgi:hypothetical protein